MMNPSGAARVLIFLSCLVILASCRSYQLEKKLSPDEREFLSKVRFIITNAERKVLLRLPESEREAFIQEFWAKRDPDPYTEENEFKIEYFARIESANRMFRGEGTPGWLTDRGRVYILFGPPFSRKYYPTEVLGGIQRAREVWYYGNFPVIFVDEKSNGVFRLLSTNLAHLGEINYALRKSRKDHEDLVEKGTQDSFILDFSLELGEASNIPVIVVKIPYSKIWLEYKPDKEMLETTLSLDLIVLASNEKIVLRHNDDYHISMTEKSLKDRQEEDLIIEIPVILAKGEYSVQATLTNTTGDKKTSKTFRIKV
jgi:GWxTD domain-containing protein